MIAHGLKNEPCKWHKGWAFELGPLKKDKRGGIRIRLGYKVGFGPRKAANKWALGFGVKKRGAKGVGWVHALGFEGKNEKAIESFGFVRIEQLIRFTGSTVGSGGLQLKGQTVQRRGDQTKKSTGWQSDQLNQLVQSGFQNHGWNTLS